jgi:hypothetical protein
MPRLSRDIASQIAGLSNAAAARLITPLITIAIEAHPAIAAAEKLATALQAHGLPACASGDIDIYDGTLQLLVMSTAAPHRIEETLAIAGLPHQQLANDQGSDRITALYEVELDHQRVHIAISHDAAAPDPAAQPPVGLYHEPEAEAAPC